LSTSILFHSQTITQAVFAEGCDLIQPPEHRAATIAAGRVQPTCTASASGRHTARGEGVAIINRRVLRVLDTASLSCCCSEGDTHRRRLWRGTSDENPGRSWQLDLGLVVEEERRKLNIESRCVTALCTSHILMSVAKFLRTCISTHFMRTDVSHHAHAHGSGAYSKNKVISIRPCYTTFL